MIPGLDVTKRSNLKHNISNITDNIMIIKEILSTLKIIQNANKAQFKKID